MELNTIKPAAGSKKNRRRVGRGIGSGLVPNGTKRAKVILAGKVEKKFKLTGIGASKGAKEAIEKAGGTVEPLPPKPAPAKLVAKK